MSNGAFKSLVFLSVMVIFGDASARENRVSLDTFAAPIPETRQECIDKCNADLPIPKPPQKETDERKKERQDCKKACRENTPAASIH